MDGMSMILFFRLVRKIRRGEGKAAFTVFVSHLTLNFIRLITNLGWSSFPSSKKKILFSQHSLPPLSPSVCRRFWYIPSGMVSGIRVILVRYFPSSVCLFLYNNYSLRYNTLYLLKGKWVLMGRMLLKHQMICDSTNENWQQSGCQSNSCGMGRSYITNG